MITSVRWLDSGETVAHIEYDDGTIRSGVTSASRFWQSVQGWAALGNTPDPFIPPVPAAAPLTAEELYNMLVTKGVVTPVDRARP